MTGHNQKRSERLSVNFSKGRLKARLNAMSFMEGDSYIIYLPSVKISAYGDTLDEAKEMIEVCLEEFSKDIIKLNSKVGMDYLRGLGWKEESYFKKRMIALSTTSFEDIKKEFDLPDNIVVNELSFNI